MKARFKKSVTLKEMVDYLKSVGCSEITRIIIGKKFVIVEWNEDRK